MTVTIINSDALTALRTLPSESVQCVVTSPPYFQLRSYLPADHPDKALEVGMQQTPAEFIAALVDVFDEVRRVLRPDGVCFVNIGDSYSGSGKGPTTANSTLGAFTGPRGFNADDKVVQRTAQVRQGFHSRVTNGDGIPPKNLLLIPQRFAIAMQDAGWTVRSCIAWCKTSAMPESVRDRPTSAWEPIYMFTKSARYSWDQEAVRQPATMAPQRRSVPHAVGRGPARQNGAAPVRDVPMQDAPEAGANIRNYWVLGPEPSREEHYAAFPSEIPRRCIKAASRPGDTVLDPFLGSGTTALVADQLGRHAIGLELNPEYAEMARRRIERDAPMVSEPVTVTTEPAQIGLGLEVAS